MFLSDGGNGLNSFNDNILIILVIYLPLLDG